MLSQELLVLYILVQLPNQNLFSVHLLLYQIKSGTRFVIITHLDTPILFLFLPILGGFLLSFDHFKLPLPLLRNKTQFFTLDLPGSLLGCEVADRGRGGETRVGHGGNAIPRLLVDPVSALRVGFVGTLLLLWQGSTLERLAGLELSLPLRCATHGSG